MISLLIEPRIPDQFYLCTVISFRFLRSSCSILPKRSIMSGHVNKEVLKGEINKVTLRPTEPVVKGVLPTKEDLQSERAHHSLIQGIEKFDKNKLEHAETKEPRLPNAIDIEVERHANMPSPNLNDVPKVGPDFKNELNQIKLHHTETQVKVRLPSESDLIEEKKHHDLISGIEGFNKKQLNHQEVQEASALPSAEDLKTERVHHDVIQGVENFDKKALNHANPTEKIVLPTAADIQREREGLHSK
ncbi:hypothetical protein RvY_15927 [Ramazzottius varieornatus]|uniref:Thymosin beta n=1 Tax=Ramazzottius varieornatus TaxID=947166 RepID=A0A1D1VZP6_RAMVA|nr:hypothetical protein RvY_15927 [Ramazzottius varieornatus]